MRKSKWLQTALLCIGGVFLFLAGIGLGWIRCRQTETAFWENILIAPEPEECVVRGLLKIVSDAKFKHLAFSMKNKILL